MRLIYAAAILVVCSSCSVYNYNILKSNIQGTERDPFAYEDDSLKLRYAFRYGEGRLSVQNKMKRPLYIDWTRSSIIFNGESRTFTEIGDGRETTFIPPHAAVNEIPFGMPIAEPRILVGKAPTEHTYYTRYNSPANFRSYLVMSPTEDFYETITTDHQFWVAESWQTNEQQPIGQRPDVIYYSTLTPEGEVATALVGTALGIGLVVLAVSNEPIEQEP